MMGEEIDRCKYIHKHILVYVYIQIKRDIQENNQKLKSYLLYEIVYNADESIKAKQIFEKIKKSISKDGFQNTAAIFSISKSSKSGGKLGWINQ
mgnify:CR=1 FL=1